MGWEAYFSLAVVLATVALLAITSIGPDVVMVGGVTLLMLAGVLAPKEALAGLSNEGMATVGAMYVVVAGLTETGGLAWIAAWMLGRPRSQAMAQLRMMIPIAAVSAFMNNTPVVAMFIPVVADWAKQLRIPVSRLMIPLSYATILGGTCSLIGTSTNMVVQGLAIDADLPPLGLFEIAWVGLPAATIGIGFLLLVGRRLLPDRTPAIGEGDDPRRYTVEMIVQPGGPLVGRSIEAAGLRHLQGVFLVEIDREGQILAAVGPEERLRAGDRLVFAGVVDSVVDLRKIRGLEAATDQVFKLDAPRTARCLVEAVVSPSCPLVGRSIREGRFRTAYNAVVIAVAREGERINKKIGDIVLRPGDTLLLETHPSFADQQRNARDFFLVSRLENSAPVRHDRALVALAVLAALVAAASSGLLSMFQAAMLGGGLMILTRCCSATTARRSVDWQVLVMIAASLGLGRALETSGAAAGLAGGLVRLAGGHPWTTLVVIYAATLILTELISNNAAAALVFPIALSTAADLGVSNRPFLIVLMMAASAGFATPIGYQTNLMVYGPGGYRFSDYLRIGVPLDLLVMAVTVAITPLAFPF